MAFEHMDIASAVDPQAEVEECLSCVYPSSAGKTLSGANGRRPLLVCPFPSVRYPDLAAHGYVYCSLRPLDGSL